MDDLAAVGCGACAVAFWQVIAKGAWSRTGATVKVGYAEAAVFVAYKSVAATSWGTGRLNTEA